VRITVRVLGLDVLDLTIETDGDPATSPGDVTTAPVGFALTEAPAEVAMPDRS
jgi:hypothetical protein